MAQPVPLPQRPLPHPLPIPPPVSTTHKAVVGFLPSTNGFHFSNSSFAEVPDLHLGLPVIGDVPIGNAQNGVCGGMAFTVRDFFESRAPIPPDTVAPSAGQLFDYIVMRLFDSFNAQSPGTGIPRYLQLMDPGMADGARATVMITEEWPKVKADLDQNSLSPLALIEVLSTDPGDLGHNHQVLVYGYDEVVTALETTVVMHIYDPNFPGDDTVTITLSFPVAQTSATVVHSKHGGLHCFFQQIYAYENVVNGGFAVAERWKQGLSVPFQVGTAVLTGGISWLADEAAQLIGRLSQKPVLTWDELDGRQLPGGYHLNVGFSAASIPGAVEFALVTDKNSYKKQVAFQAFDPATNRFNNLYYANDFQPDKSPGAPQHQTASATITDVKQIPGGCFEFDSQDGVGGLPGRYLLTQLGEKLTAGTRVTFTWLDVH